MRLREIWNHIRETVREGWSEGWEKGTNRKGGENREGGKYESPDVVRNALVALLLVFFAFVFIVVGLALVIRMVGSRW